MILTPGKWFYCPTPLPSGISWASDPPPPTSLKFPILSVVGVWIFSGTCTHCLKIYILLHILNKNENIVNVGYWVLSKNLRNFRCNISVRHPSIQSLVGREGNKVSAHRGVEYVIFSWWEIVQEMAHSFLSSSKTCLLYKLLFKYFMILWPWCSASSKWFRKNCYHNGSTKWKYTAAIKIFLCVPKARGWPWGWQMPELWAMQNLLMLHPQDWKGIQIPHSCPGSAWEHLKLTDA